MMIIKMKGKADIKSFIRASLGSKYSEFGGEKKSFWLVPHIL